MPITSKIVQLKNDKDQSIYYYPATLGSAVYVNNQSIVGSDGKILSTFLPSYVDDVIEGYYYNGAFYEDSAHQTQITGETGKIYVSLDTNYQYRWSGSGYVQMTNGNFATGAKFGSGDTSYYGLGSDTYLDLPDIVLNGTHTYASNNVTSLTWWAPTTAGVGGNLLKSGGSGNAPVWLANPSDKSRILWGTSAGAVWDTTTLPSSAAASKILMLTSNGAAWSSAPANPGEFLMSTSTGLVWTSLTNSTYDTILSGLEVSTQHRGFAPIIPTSAGTEPENISALGSDALVLTAKYGDNTETRSSSWKFINYANSNWPSVPISSESGLMTGDQVELLKKLEWVVLPFNAGATMSPSTTLILKPANTTSVTLTITATKDDVTVDANGVPSKSSVTLAHDKYNVADNGSTGGGATVSSPTIVDNADTMQYTITPGGSTKNTVTLKWKALYMPDGSTTQATATGSKSLTMVHQTVWGYAGNISLEEFTANVDDYMNNTNDVNIVDVNNTTTYSSGHAYSNKSFTITRNNRIVLGRLWFAYPSEYGNVTDIKDGNGYSYINDFTKLSDTYTLSTNGHSTAYNVYFKNNASEIVAGYKWIIS